MPDLVNIAVVGAGAAAQSVHLPLLRRRWDRFAIAALADLSPRRRQEAADVYGIPEEARFEDAAAVIAAIRAKEIAVDAAVIASDGLHAEDVLAFVRRGIPVLVEPPLGFSAAEIRRIADFERMAGRRLVMIAHPQQYDEVLRELGERAPQRDLRMLDYEVRMPAAQALVGHANVTVSAYDLPSELRAERRDALEEAVIAGTGEAATQRDRDLYVKGLLTGLVHQLAVIEAAYGPIDRIEAVRQWPAGVTPGSLEVLGRLEGEAPFRLLWHYLPFSPEYSETLTLTTARRRMVIDVPAPTHPARLVTATVREKDGGAIQQRSETSQLSPAESMWEAFGRFAARGEEPAMTSDDAARQAERAREILAVILEADGRSLDPEPEADPAPEPEPEPEAESDPAPGALETADEQVPGEELPPVEGMPIEDAPEPGSPSETTSGEPRT